MVNSFTTGKGRLVQPPYGAYVDEWQRPVNSDFGLVDALVSGTTTLNVATLTPSSPFFTLVFQDFDTSTTPWLNPLAGQNLRIAVTGALAFNITIFIPANVPGMWFVDASSLTGAYTAVIKTTAAGSVGVTLANGKCLIVFCDGTNVILADSGNTAAIATNTTYGLVTWGALPGNAPILDTYALTPTVGKTPASNDKYIISTSDPDSAQGAQNWLWMKV
jgi:hypothetical protein